MLWADVRGRWHRAPRIRDCDDDEVIINQLDFDIASMQYYFKAGTCQLPSTGMACIERHVSSEITLIRSRVMTQFLQALKEAKFASFRLVRESIKDHCL